MRDFHPLPRGIEGIITQMREVVKKDSARYKDTKIQRYKIEQSHWRRFFLYLVWEMIFVCFKFGFVGLTEESEMG